jgi:hypothetical protein
MPKRKNPPTGELEQRYPWGLYAGGSAICPDGKVRRLKWISETPDTFFSIPASITVKNVSVSGYVTTAESPNGNRLILFRPYDRPNADKVFPKKPFITEWSLEWAARYPSSPAVSSMERF